MKHASKDNNNVCVHSVHSDSFTTILQRMLTWTTILVSLLWLQLNISVSVPVHTPFSPPVIYAELPAAQLNCHLWWKKFKQFFFCWYGHRGSHASWLAASCHQIPFCHTFLRTLFCHTFLCTPFIFPSWLFQAVWSVYMVQSFGCLQLFQVGNEHFVCISMFYPIIFITSGWWLNRFDGFNIILWNSNIDGLQWNNSFN